ncbi:MAG: FISUMP domain-containing protein [Massilibacteroides sp.]|nr:FISUMP domain-containing protein [Massilibacteroides sp.]
MKKYLIFLLPLFFWLSCSEKWDGEDIPVADDQAIVRMELKGLGGSSLRSYADVIGAEADEIKVDSIKVYVFGTSSGDPDLLEAVYTIPKSELTQITGGSSDGYTADFAVTTVDGTEKWFEVLANGIDTIAIRSGMSYEGFKSVTSRILTDEPEPGFLMEGSNKATPTVGTSTSLSIELTRLVARVDVTVRANKSPYDEATANFKLTDSRLTNIADRSFLVPQVTYPAEAVLLTNLPWLTQAATNETVVGTDEQRLWNAHYLYESAKSADNKPVTLEVKGKYLGEDAYYQIPIDMKIERNHRYLVQIDSVTLAGVSATIKVLDWESDTIVYTPGVGEYLTVSYNPDGVKKVLVPEARSSFDAGEYPTDTIRFVNLNEGDTLKVKTASTSVSTEFFTSTSWIRQKEMNRAMVDSVEQEFVIEIDPSVASSTRGALIVFRNPEKPTVMRRLYIEQPGNPLLKWATVNLTGVGTPDLDAATALTSSTAGNAAYYGAWFQWGRNVAFTNAASIPSGEENLAGPFAPTATEVSGTKFITATVSANYVWYTGYGLQDTWRKITGQTQSVSLGTDPCPDGWRLPTADEIAAIMPINSTVGDYDEAANTNYTDESTTATYYTDEGEKVTADYSPASYFTGSTTIRYGIKQAGTANAAIFKWEYKTTYLIISCLRVDASFTATSASDISTAFSSAATSQVLVRYFPAAGYRYVDGSISSRGTNGLYWSSSSHSSASQYAWNLGFSSVSARLNLNGRAYGFSVRCVKGN